MFFKGSRYETTEVLELTDENGRILRYIKTRFVPQTTAQLVHITTSGERLDHIAFKYYRDAERFWRICDANGMMWPEALTAEANKHILIPPSSG